MLDHLKAMYLHKLWLKDGSWETGAVINFNLTIYVASICFWWEQDCWNMKLTIYSVSLTVSFTPLSVSLCACELYVTVSVQYEKYALHTLLTARVLIFCYILLPYSDHLNIIPCDFFSLIYNQSILLCF